MKKLFLGLVMLLAFSLARKSYANEDCDSYAQDAAVKYYVECGVDLEESADFYDMMYNDCVNAKGEMLDPVIFC